MWRHFSGLVRNNKPEVSKNKKACAFASSALFRLKTRVADERDRDYENAKRPRSVRSFSIGTRGRVPTVGKLLTRFEDGLAIGALKSDHLAVMICTIK